MKKLLVILMCACLISGCALAAEGETEIILSNEKIAVSGANADAVVLEGRNETHEDVPEELKDLNNRVVSITDGGAYRISGNARDTQICVEAGEDDSVRIILDGVELSCRTAPAILVRSANDPRIAGEYAVTIELAGGSENNITGSHTKKLNEDDVKFDGAITSLVSLGFEGSGSLNLDADNEGIEVKFGHMTVNGGTFNILAGDDPLNVSEDEIGTLTVNDGYLFSSVKNEAGGEGDGVDSNGYIVFNGGTIINLAHPESGDSGIDSDMGSSINGGIVVGAGNMYDPIDENSNQLFMMLEFAEPTDDLVVVTEENGNPVFAYDFPYSYRYIAFSTPELKEGAYRVYLGGEIDGDNENGLYTNIRSYTPGQAMQHGGSEGGMQMMPQMGQGPDMGGRNPFAGGFGGVDLNEILAGVDLNELLAGKDLNGLLTGFDISDILSAEQIEEYFGDTDFKNMQGFGGSSFGGPRGMERSAEIATDLFMLSGESTGYTGISAAN